MDPRNLLGRGALKPDMISDLSARFLPAARGLDPAETVLAAPDIAEERALVERSRSGDQDAFALLVRLHQRQVYALALRMLRDGEEASEATQDVFLAAWQALRGYRGDSRFSTWLYRIAYNHCLRLVEQRKRHAAAQAEVAAESVRAQSPAGAMSAHHAADAEREMRETVRDQIANLPPKYRLVVILRHLQDLSYEEIAEVMRMPIGTVKTHLFRARAMLKERLDDLGRARDEKMTKASGLRGEVEKGLRVVLDPTRQATQRGDGQ